MASSSASASEAMAQPAFDGIKKIVAVSRFENNASIASGGEVQITNGLADQLADALIQSQRFVVVERQTLTDVIGEQDLANSGRVAKAQSARTGKLTAAQILVKGAVTEFQMDSAGGSQGVSLFGVKLGSKKAEAHVAVIIRLIDTTTGQILASRRVEGVATETGTDFGVAIAGIGFENSNFKKTPLGKATQVAIDNAVNFIGVEMGKQPFKGRVVLAEGGQIIVSAGEQNNARVGDTFTVFKVGKELKDPSTGELLGRIEKEIGVLKIVTVKEKYSFVKKVGSFPGTKVGDYIKFKSRGGA